MAASSRERKVWEYGGMGVWEYGSAPGLRATRATGRVAGGQMQEESPHRLDNAPGEKGPAGSIREMVFGVEDGLVSILGLVTGVAAGTTSASFVLLAGVAGALSGAVSMAAGTYLGVKSQIEALQRVLHREERSIHERPQHERAELADYYREHGFSLRERRVIIPAIMRNSRLLMEEMAAHEYGISASQLENPVQRAFWIFITYIIVSAFPVLPYAFLERSAAMAVSLAGTVVVLFAVGALKTVFTGLNWLRSGLEMLAVAALAGVVGYLAGHFAAV